MITSQRQENVQLIVLVAGGADFIGSFLCETLLLNHCQVICLDDLSSGKKENLNNCFTSSDFIFYRHNLDKPLTGEILSSFLKRGEGLPKYIFQLTNAGKKNLLDLVRQSRAKFLRVVKKERNLSWHDEIDMRVVFITNAYGPRMDLEKNEPMVQLIKSAVLSKPFKIPNDGSTKVYPTFISDLVYGLTKAMFGLGTRGKFFRLVNSQGISLLTLTQTLQRQVKKQLEIKFIHFKEQPLFLRDGKVEKQKDLNWQPKVDLETGISQTLSFFQKTKPKKKVSLSFNRRLLTWGLSFLICIFIFLPFFSLYLNGFLGFKSIKDSQQNVIKGDFKKATQRAERAQVFLARAVKKNNQLFSIFNLFGQQELIDRQEKLLNLGMETAKALTHLNLAIEKASYFGQNIFKTEPGLASDRSKDINQKVGEIKTELDLSFHQLSLIEAQLKSPGIKNPLEKAVKNLPEVRELIIKAKKALPLLPSLLGVNKQQTYLVLLQNSNELRPTGGFIGSFALLTFNQASLVDFEVQDVYWADGQLKGHVEPPAALRKYLGEAGWFLRDSNWDPNFPTAARQAAWFLEKETGRTVDGVLGLTLFGVQKILKVLDEVEVADFQEKITAENLFGRAEYYSEFGFFPGSTQKKDFLASLTKALFEKIKTADQRIWLDLGQAVYQSLKSKDLLVYLNDERAMEIISDLNWHGGVTKINCLNSSQSCLADYLMIVEANVGVNKTNFFIKRNLSHQVMIEDDGAIKEKLKIVYQNDSPTESFPGGPYKNYLRILTPLGSKLEGVFIEGKELEEKAIDQENNQEKTVFGFFVEVPIKEKRLIEINYQLNDKISLTEISQYLFLLQKQPGIKEEIFNLELEVPSEVFLLEAKPPAVFNGQSWLFNSQFNTDMVFEASLVK